MRALAPLLLFFGCSGEIGATPVFDLAPPSDIATVIDAPTGSPVDARSQPPPTTDLAPPDPCASLQCDDGDGCTTDSCAAGMCAHADTGVCNQPLIRDGAWNDVAATPSGWLSARIAASSDLVVEVNGSEVARFAAANLLYVRVFVDPALHHWWVVGQSGTTGRTALYSDVLTGAADIGPSFGQQCVALGWDGAHVIAYGMPSGDHYFRVTLDPATGAQLSSQTFPCTATSQGWLDVSPAADASQDVLLWTDSHRTVTLAGITMDLPTTRNGFTVGQPVAGPPQVPGVFGTTPTSLFIGRMPALWPHLAALDNGTFVVSTPLVGGSCIFEIFDPNHLPAYQ